MSSYVKVYVKPDCEKSSNAIDMILEFGEIDEIVVVGDINDSETKAFGETLAEYANEISYLSEDSEELDTEFDGEPLPQVMFDSFNVDYEKLLNAYESEELDSYFT